MINLKSIPFFKILLPYVLGIVFTLRVGLFDQLHVALIVSFLFLLLSFLFQKYYTPVFYLKKGIFILCTNVFLFLLAQEACFLYNAKNNKNHYSHYVSQQQQGIIAVVNDVPVYTESYTKLSIKFTVIEQNNSWHYANGNTIVYLKKDVKRKLAIGSTIFISSKLSYVNPPQNPLEFDYKSFLENKNIFHVIYANQVYESPEIQQAFSFSQLGTKIKAHVVAVLKESGLSKQAFSICSALLVGYDDEIDSDTMQSFAHSGTLHVLSVSGMHTGVLYGLLLLIFKLFDKNDKRKKLKCGFVILSLIVFAFITGLSPSVLRASLMLALIIIGKTFYKQGNGYNTLFLSAFLLLLTNPYLLLDVGFLLSYLAVFGIMYLHPILSGLYYFENKILQWCWNLTIMSVAATVFTLPVSLYFFHQFPIWFMFSNLIIIPISIGLMILSFALIVCYKIMIIKQGLVSIINLLTKTMMWFAELTDNNTYGYIDYISFTTADIVCCFLCIYCLFVIIQTKQYKQVVVFGLVCIAWLSFSIYTNYQESQQRELVVFHIKKKTAYSLRIGKTVYTCFDTLPQQDFQRFVKPYLLGFSNPKLIPVNNEVLKSPFATILHLHKKDVNASEIPADYIIVSNDTPVSLLNNHKTKPLIIADCSNSYKFVKELKKQCLELEIPFCSIKESGAVQINLN